MHKIEPGEESPAASDELWVKRDYYLNKEYLARFTPDLIGFVNGELDKEVMDTIGYVYVSV
jgi:hypothetical protein